MGLPEKIVLTLNQPQYLAMIATLNDAHSVQLDCINYGTGDRYLMYHKNRAMTIKKLIRAFEAQVEEQTKNDPAGEGADRAVCEG